jgi:hypothetical protein
MSHILRCISPLPNLLVGQFCIRSQVLHSWRRQEVGPKSIYFIPSPLAVIKYSLSRCLRIGSTLRKTELLPGLAGLPNEFLYFVEEMDEAWLYRRAYCWVQSSKYVIDGNLPDTRENSSDIYCISMAIAAEFIQSYG